MENSHDNEKLNSGGISPAVAGIMAMAMAGGADIDFDKNAQNSLIMKVLMCKDRNQASEMLTSWENEARRVRTEILPAIRMDGDE